MTHRHLFANLLTGVLLICHAGAFADISTSAIRCSAESGAQRTALLELFTSEGCSSCPPADRWLSRLRARPNSAQGLAPLAFHVDYWNRLGWSDRFSKPAYSARQRWIANINHARTIYTPQFVLDGRDAHPMRSNLPEFQGKRAADADLRLELGPASGERLEIRGEARLRTASEHAQVFLALYENNLSSRITEGENAGKLLRHDFVVRELIGPLRLPTSGKLPLQHTFSLGADWKRNDLGVTAFVQDARTGEVYQTLQVAACKS